MTFFKVQEAMKKKYSVLLVCVCVCVFVTYIANVWPVTSVCSQNAVQHIVIGPALMMDKDII